MLTAKEARDTVNKAKTERSQQQLAKILERIEIAVKSNKLDCYWDGIIDAPVRAKLEELGYIVGKTSSGGFRGESSTEISWRSERNNSI
jgi:hypothetical protein